MLLDAPAIQITGHAFNCTDRYVSDLEVAQIAQKLSGSSAVVQGQTPQPKHQIATGKIQRLGMVFGGTPLLEKTIGQLVNAAG